MWQYQYSNELYHYGIPGMRWGVRKAVSSGVKYALRHPVVTGALISGGSAVVDYARNKAYVPKNKKAYDRNKSLYGATNARKMDWYRAKYGGSQREALNYTNYGRRGAQRIERRIKNGDSRSKAEFKEMGVKVGKTVAVNAALFAVTTPYFRRTASRGMRHVGKAYKYMRHTRYNKAVQLRDPGYRYVKAKWTIVE